MGTADSASWPHAVHSSPVSHSPSAASLSRAASEAVGGPGGPGAAAATAAAGLGLLQPHPSGSHGHARSSLHSFASIKRDMQVRLMTSLFWTGELGYGTSSSYWTSMGFGAQAVELCANRCQLHNGRSSVRLRYRAHYFA